MEKDVGFEKLAAALSKAQGEFTTPPKNNKVKYKQTEYSFANLATIIEHNKKAMLDNGLAITQVMDYEGEAFGLKTILIHSSGQWVSSFHPLPDPSKMPAQDFGSRLTYARRYSYQTIQGIEAEKDDDGALEQNNFEPAKPRASNPAVPPAPKNHAPPTRLVTDDEAKNIWGQLQSDHGLTVEDTKLICRNVYKVEGLMGLNIYQAKDLFSKLNDGGRENVLASLAGSK